MRTTGVGRKLAGNKLAPRRIKAGGRDMAEEERILGRNLKKPPTGKDILPSLYRSIVPKHREKKVNTNKQTLFLKCMF